MPSPNSSDVTKQKRAVQKQECKKAEEVLNKKQQELNLILDSSPTIIFYKDNEGKFIQVNKAFAEALKVPKEKLLGKTVFDLYSAKIAQAMTDDDIVVLNSKQPKLGIIEPYESPTGIRWIRTDKVPILDENGAVTGLIGFSEDITERKKAEEEHIRSSQRINEILESISDDFMVLDSNWNYVYANSQAAKLVGLEPKEIVGKNFWQLFPQNKGTHIEENLREAMAKREVRRFELLGQYSHKYKLITTYPSVEGIALIATDITERKHLEKQLQEKERLATIGQTAGMVGHDLRNPLQSIIGEVYLAKAELKLLPESEQKACLQESLQTIAEQIGYMDKIVSDLQTFVKPVEPQMQIVKLKPLIVALLAQQSIPNNIQTNLQIRDVPPAEADPQLLKRVFINLITNAVQAMPQGGELVIKTDNCKQGRVQVVVEDTGIGIPEEVKPKIFTPLFTTKSKGQGFGLAVCKRVLEAQGGTISFESQVGKGTKFNVSLPVHKSI